MRRGALLIITLGFGVPALAEDARTSKARLAIEQQLSEMVKLPNPSVEIVFDGIDSTRYRLVEASFELDSQGLSAKVPSGKSSGAVVLFSGSVSPGPHTLIGKLLYEQVSASGVLSYGEGTKFKIPGKFIFTAHRGIFMRVHTRVEVDDGAELQKRLQLVGDVEADLRSKLEDGTLPPSPEPNPGPAPDPLNRPTPASGSPTGANSPPRKRRHKDVQVGAAAHGGGDRAVKSATYSPSSAGDSASGRREVSDILPARLIDEGTAAVDATATIGADAGNSAPPPNAGEHAAVNPGAPPAASIPVPIRPAPPPSSQRVESADVLIGVGAFGMIAACLFAYARSRR